MAETNTHTNPEQIPNQQQLPAKGPAVAIAEIVKQGRPAILEELSEPEIFKGLSRKAKDEVENIDTGMKSLEGLSTEVIAKMIEIGGPESLEGLSLEVNNNIPASNSILPRGIPGSKEYVIRGV